MEAYSVKYKIHHVYRLFPHQVFVKITDLCHIILLNKDFLFYILLLDCGTFPTLDNGVYVLVNSSNTTYGAPASVQCNTGYNSSIDAITCTENGTWSTTQCLAVGK